jgi:hypothetical protein
MMPRSKRSSSVSVRWSTIRSSRIAFASEVRPPRSAYVSAVCALPKVLTWYRARDRHVVLLERGGGRADPDVTPEQLNAVAARLRVLDYLAELARREPHVVADLLERDRPAVHDLEQVLDEVHHDSGRAGSGGRGRGIPRGHCDAGERGRLPGGQQVGDEGGPEALALQSVLDRVVGEGRPVERLPDALHRLVDRAGELDLLDGAARLLQVPYE